MTEINSVSSLLIREGFEQETFSVIKLGLELDPVKPETVEEGRQAFHHAQDADGQEGPEGEDDEHDQRTVPVLTSLKSNGNVKTKI